MKDQTSTSIHQNTRRSEHASLITHHCSETQQSTTPSIHSPTSLQLFTHPAILREIGPARLAKFLAGFNGELPPALAKILAALSNQPAKDQVSSLGAAADDALNTLPALAPSQ